MEFRVALAMVRRGDLPRRFEEVRDGSPRVVPLLTRGSTATLVLLGDIKRTRSFSALTVLIYYALTNLSALRMPTELRRYPAGPRQRAWWAACPWRSGWSQRSGSPGWGCCCSAMRGALCCIAPQPTLYPAVTLVDRGALQRRTTSIVTLPSGKRSGTPSGGARV